MTVWVTDAGMPTAAVRAMAINILRLLWPENPASKKMDGTMTMPSKKDYRKFFVLSSGPGNQYTERMLWAFSFPIMDRNPASRGPWSFAMRAW